MCEEFLEERTVQKQLWANYVDHDIALIVLSANHFSIAENHKNHDILFRST